MYNGLNDELIGKYAYKKLGFFSGLIGIIEKSDYGISPYKLTFKSSGSVGICRLKDIEIVDENDVKFKLNTYEGND